MALASLWGRMYHGPVWFRAARNAQHEIEVKRHKPLAFVKNGRFVLSFRLFGSFRRGNPSAIAASKHISSVSEGRRLVTALRTYRTDSEREKKCSVEMWQLLWIP